MPHTQRNPTTIALVLRTGLEFGRDIALGIGEHLGSRSDVRAQLLPLDPERAQRAIEHSSPDGIIAQAYPQLQGVLRAAGLPLVNVTCPSVAADMPCVSVDSKAIGRKAAEHLLERGYMHFAFVGGRGAFETDLREAGFIEVLEEAAGRIRSHSNVLSAERGVFDPASTEFREWLGSLPHPVGVFAHDDHLAARVLRTCEDLGLTVPDEVAIVGAGNDPMCCEISTPQLSSIRLPTHRIGRGAAALIESLIAGNPPPEAPILFPPLDVVARGSTALVAGDERLRDAVKFIRRHIADPITVGYVADKICVSRRWLERNFKRRFGRPPAEQIMILRISRAQQLLVDTNLPVSEVAYEAGFSTPSQFSVTFKRRTGKIPSEYRESQV